MSITANTLPIFCKAPDVQWIGPCTAANNNTDLTAGTSYLLFTADATNGGIVEKIRCKANPANSTVATVMRVWINNGNTIATASNSILFDELGIPATTTSASAAQASFDMLVNIKLPLGYKLYVTFGTAPGGSGSFAVSALGGKY